MPPAAEIEVMQPPSVSDFSHSWHGPRSSSKHFELSPDTDDGLEVDGDLPRSASYTDLPTLIESTGDGSIKRTFSENVLTLPSESTNSVTDSTYTSHRDILRRASQKSKNVKPTVSLLQSDAPAGPTANVPLQPPVVDIPRRKSEVKEKDQPKMQKSVSGTIRGFVKKPWKSPSKSDAGKETKKLEKAKNKSPMKQKLTRPKETVMKPEFVPSTRSNSTSSTSRSPSPVKPEVVKSVKSERPSLSRRSTVLSKTKRPLSAIIGGRSDSDPVIRKSPSLRSLRSMASQDKLTPPSIPVVSVPPIPPEMLSDKSSKPSIESNKRKDPLWGAFRSLEGDYQKFLSKSSSLKVNVIRSSLIPFLNRYATHPSNKTLRVEDLDRRVMILNKWWSGLMEMLNGKNNQSISGMDRPVFLEAVTGIMTRSEWRTPPLPSSSNVTTSDIPSLARPETQATSTTSLESTGSDFLADPIYQNVRNIFIQNLLSQMGFVVDKMSLRNAPASLVTFCGKACAYAFFFVPGVADILSRLWALTADSLRRTVSEFGCRRSSSLHQKSDEISAMFPEALRALSFSSHAALCKRLRQQPTLPMGTSSIRWFGPWLNRWTGRESDLFFVFTKHFHILVSEFLPEPLTIQERLFVPGLVLVHAQILTVLEATLYRQAQAGQDRLENLSYTLFEDIEGPDASAATMPLTSANAVRSMAENRLIMLLRDLLADKNPDHHNVRHLYASSFDNIVKAAARRMSLFDNNACFVLCDFMEEVLVITFRYQQQTPDFDLFDWPFWFDVCRKMMQSHNSLTEVRLFAFVYGMWNLLIDDMQRRRDLCLNWLLEPSFFQRYFNHWSPMVRGYFYRLLCWRLARVDQDGVSDSLQILHMFQQRLDEVWAQYLYLRQEAEDCNLALPSTAPCSPAPGRRLVILRIDSQPLPASLFMSWDNPSQQRRQNQTTSYRSHSSLLDSVSAPEEPPPPSKKRWSVLRGMVPFGNPGNNRPGEVTPPGSASEDNSPGAEEVQSSKRASGGIIGETVTGASTPSHQAFSFKFSLEWLDRPNWPSRNRQLSPPKLPQFAQEIVEASPDGIPKSSLHPTKPRHDQLASSKYCGRALAEWQQVLSECNSFFDRRRDEGVPLSRLVETPTLSVESFRMFG